MLVAKEEEVGIEPLFNLVEVLFSDVEAVARVEIAACLGALFDKVTGLMFPLAELAEFAVKDRERAEGRLDESSLVKSIRLLNELMITGSRMSI